MQECNFKYKCEFENIHKGIVFYQCNLIGEGNQNCECKGEENCILFKIYEKLNGKEEKSI